MNRRDSLKAMAGGVLAVVSPLPVVKGTWGHAQLPHEMPGVCSCTYQASPDAWLITVCHYIDGKEVWLRWENNQWTTLAGKP
jgi:hypothetical protein